MMRDTERSRRGVLGGAGLATGTVLVAAVGRCRARKKKATEGKEKEKGEAQVEVPVTPPEDLMREHAVLERLLLIYEKALAAGSRPADWPMTQLAAATGLIRTFIEDYHEKLEENYIFPRFEKAGKLTDLTAVLLQQHQAGRQVTDAVLRQIKQAGSLPDTQALASNLRAFLRMYRPHAARESTVLFPQIGDRGQTERVRRDGRQIRGDRAPEIRPGRLRRHRAEGRRDREEPRHLRPGLVHAEADVTGGQDLDKVRMASPGATPSRSSIPPGRGNPLWLPRNRAGTGEGSQTR